ncbi:hypothetical protein MG293_000430 [Ovis ammon polii]|uniref:Uncharacterized protein n=1 Tax=Ovis ammon polii TaxID=230172 RepID=A0AAD4UPT2_OVIAM|nr:hypothetical protein MG293_000430 [Ovis ammon polii]
MVVKDLFQNADRGAGSREEIPLVQVKEQRLRFAGAAVKRHPTSKVDTEPLFEFPEPYSKFPLAIYFTYDAGSFCVQESRAEELWQEGFCSSLPVELHGSTISQLEEDRREDKVCSDCKASSSS